MRKSRRRVRDDWEKCSLIPGAGPFSGAIYYVILSLLVRYLWVECGGLPASGCLCVMCRLILWILEWYWSWQLRAGGVVDDRVVVWWSCGSYGSMTTRYIHTRSLWSWKIAHPGLDLTCNLDLFPSKHIFVSDYNTACCFLTLIVSNETVKKIPWICQHQWYV